jgi:hypothetical protein
MSLINLIMKKKVFIFLPDGVGLNNFVSAQFKVLEEQKRIKCSIVTILFFKH